MASEINGLPPINRHINQAGNEQGKARGNQNGSEPATAGDQVSITGAANRLNALQEQVRELPVVDSSRVDAIKAAIANGTFQVDADRVAAKFVALESTLDRSN